jgi:hypothetical protein
MNKSENKVIKRWDANKGAMKIEEQLFDNHLDQHEAFVFLDSVLDDIRQGRPEFYQTIQRGVK